MMLRRAAAAVIGHGYWKDQLHADKDIVGKVMIINGTNFTVVGVTPPEFFGVRMRRVRIFGYHCRLIHRWICVSRT